MIDETTIKAIRDLTGRDEKPRFIQDLPGVAFHTHGLDHTDLEKILTNPRRVYANTRHVSLDSLLAYADRFARYPLALFADPAVLTFHLVVDYHDGQYADEMDPGWCDHRATFTLTPTPAFKRWLDRDGALYAQENFADFLEDNAEVVTDPPAADLIDLVDRFQIKRDVAFSSRVDRMSGTIAFNFKEDDTVQGKITAPSEIVLELVPFVGVSQAKFRAKLRYRMRDGALTLGFRIMGIDQFKEDLFETHRERVDSHFAGREQNAVFIGSLT